jgi:hypothetical protein
MFEKCPYNIILGQPFFQDHIGVMAEDGMQAMLLVWDFDDPKKLLSLKLHSGGPRVCGDAELHAKDGCPAMTTMQAHLEMCEDNNVEIVDMTQVPDYLEHEQDLGSQQMLLQGWAGGNFGRQ